DWLEKLFANGKHNWYQLHRDHHPQPDRDVLQWASDYYLNFTHFVKLGITVVPDQANPALLVEYWCRQAAIYGIVNQNNWGMLIPIYHSPSSAPGLSDAFDPNQLSYVAIQVKNCFSPVKATDRFGPSCFYSETSPTSADATADPNAARRLAEIETMATFSQRLPGNLFLICVVAMAGTSANVFRIIKWLDDDARKDLRLLLFAFDDDMVSMTDEVQVLVGREQGKGQRPDHKLKKQTRRRRRSACAWKRIYVTATHLPLISMVMILVAVKSLFDRYERQGCVGIVELYFFTYASLTCSFRVSIFNVDNIRPSFQQQRSSFTREHVKKPSSSHRTAIRTLTAHPNAPAQKSFSR
ncbi:hypothetical protein, partial [Sporisorium scitamineum]